MSDSQKTVSTIGELAEYYRGLNPNEELYIGIELERSGVYRDTMDPVPYRGDHGYLKVFDRLIKEVGWEVLESNGDEIYELKRGDTKITTESDGRPELSGSPKVSLHNLTREFRLHEHELIEIGNVHNIAWLPVGFQPFHSNEQITPIEKKRYKIVESIAPDVDAMRSHMRRTNGLAINFSFTDEKNLIAKAQTAFRVLPIISAIYASSPFVENTRSDYLDMRRAVNAKFCPERTGVPDRILDPSFTLEDWIEFYMDIPVILIHREGAPDVQPQNLTFRQWMEEGYEGMHPTADDFDQHVKTTWSDLRLRQGYLEYRVADTVPEPLSMSLPSLMKGLVFHSEGWEAVAELTSNWTYRDILDIDKQAWKTGLQTEIDGKPLLTYAQELITIANEKLHSFERTDAQGEDESSYLIPLKEQIFIKEKSFADELVELYEGQWNQDISRMIEWFQL